MDRRFGDWVLSVDPIRVIAPATTANLGPGFDCLGMALDLWNSLDVTEGDSQPGDHLVKITGEGAGELATGEENLVYRSMKFLFEEAEREMPPVRLRCHNEIPLERGMGSSAAAIAGGLVAANTMCSNLFTPNDLSLDTTDLVFTVVPLVSLFGRRKEN